MRDSPAARTVRRVRLHFSLCALALLAPGWALAANGAPAAAGGASTPGGAAPVSSKTLLVLGDSLSAEYGLARGQGWVHLIEQRMQAEHDGYRVVNASVSGETTSGGRARLPALLAQYHPQVLVIELGANDALRGLPVASARDNLDAMAAAAEKAGARVLIAGIQVPPNYGGEYTARFAAIFEDVARDRKAALLPFLLKGVADRPDAEAWFQADRLHPLAKAHPVIADNVWPALKPLLETRERGAKQPVR